MTAAPTIGPVAVRATPVEPQPFNLRPVLAVAAAFVAVEMALAARYGYHRDELYFLACAHHLAWGYVDQPPLVPFVARVSVALFGPTVVGLRVAPALSGGVTVILTGLIARELGATRRAQLLAAVAAAVSVQVVATDHLLSTAAFDLLFWAATTFLFVRLIRTGNGHIWMAIGAVVGVGLLNKYNIGFLVAAVLAGLLADQRHRRLVLNRWAFAGGVLALAIWSPNLAWSAQHQWASVAMLRALHRENSTISASITFLPAQFLIVGPVLAPMWLGGLRRLLRHPLGRPIGVAYLVLVVTFVLSGAKPYYLGGIYFALFAAGGMWADARLDAGVSSLPRLLRWIAAGEAVAIAFALPVRPVGGLASGAWEGKIDKDLSATVGWDHVVAQIAGIAEGLPAGERAHLVVFTGDYGAAGAVDRFGSRYGLPQAFSGHNSYWWWGPPGAADGATTIAVNLSSGYLGTIFADVTPAGTVDTGHGVWTEERGAPIFICRHQKQAWAAAWPRARHYG